MFSHWKLNIWWRVCSASSYRHVFIQPSPPAPPPPSPLFSTGVGSRPGMSLMRVSHILTLFFLFYLPPALFRPLLQSYISVKLLLSEPLVTRCQPSLAQCSWGNARPSGSQAKDSSLDSSVQKFWDGEAPQLPSCHQQLHRMTNDSEKRTEEREEKMKSLPKLENVPRVRNSMQTETP